MILGLLLILFSLLPWFINLPSFQHSGMIFAVIWGMGYLIICNSIITKYTKKPKYLLRIPHGHIFVAGALAAVFIEVFGNWIWKLWYYPGFSVPAYLTLMLFVLIVYFYFILKGYMAVRAVLLAVSPKKKVKLAGRKYHKLFTSFGLLGSLGLVAGLLHASTLVNFTGIDFFNGPGVQSFSFINILLISMSLVLILEYLEYKHREDTFILHLLQGDFVPLISILIASLLTATAMEAFNIPLSIWVYTNWPYSNVEILGFPLIVLLAWPIQYVLLISLYRVLYRRETHSIWY